MSRYRPPATPGSRFITPEGHARLCAELEQLWRVERPVVTRAVSEAAAQGDRSENADYTYGKRRLREIDRRVRHLRKRLEGMVIVDRPPADRERVYFGARVTIEDESGAGRSVRIVGPDEVEAGATSEGAIALVSMDAPLGRALLGKRLDEEFRVETPEGERVYVIVRIEYRAQVG